MEACSSGLTWQKIISLAHYQEKCIAFKGACLLKRQAVVNYPWISVYNVKSCCALDQTLAYLGIVSEFTVYRHMQKGLSVDPQTTLFLGAVLDVWSGPSGNNSSKCLTSRDTCTPLASRTDCLLASLSE